MVSDTSVEEMLAGALPVIDVRSPAEFEHGHVPGALNIPLFSNDERAHVGTVYKKQSKEAAIKVGMQYVEPKLKWFIDESLKLAPAKQVIVHCWRGGMRSRSFAQHLSDNGFDTVKVIEGGYKAYRNFLLNFFEQAFHLRVVGGYTGSGKTHILEHIKLNGQQVIDLEALACHKGSAFGFINQPQQPSVEQFQNNLLEAFMQLDLQQAIWLEDESLNIGHVSIPMGLFKQMRQSVLYFIELPKNERIKLLVNEYTHCDKTLLEISLQRIGKRLGGLNLKLALEALETDDFETVADIALLYYDKSYLRGMAERQQNKVVHLPLAHINHSENSKILIERIEEYEACTTHTI
ncbi:MAG TPA: tRNA 2-selenouridine(34) synthase MnmH [Prolixibacteraceae bacterium]|nr:tRNA 2-selenouridine(34) synthase MnmH [Prolixibacteraceae bacterium]